MRYRCPVSFSFLIGAGLMLCGPTHAADDTAAICNSAISAYGTAAASGDPAKMAAVYAPDGEFVSPYGVVAGHDALVKTYASFMKPGDKQVELYKLTHDRRRGALHRRLDFHTSLGRIGRERLLDEDRRQSGR